MKGEDAHEICLQTLWLFNNIYVLSTNNNISEYSFAVIAWDTSFWSGEFRWDFATSTEDWDECVSVLISLTSEILYDVRERFSN
mgnify:CR=1 FL=1